MTDPELLKLARQARNALVVIAASCALVALVAIVILIPRLLELVSWFFDSPMRVTVVVSTLAAAVTIGVIAWVISLDAPKPAPSPKPE